MDVVNEQLIKLQNSSWGYVVNSVLIVISQLRLDFFLRHALRHPQIPGLKLGSAGYVSEVFVT